MRMTDPSNTAQYNGNISGAKWSVNQGFGTIKAMAYNYTYDAMNRLTAASHKHATTLGTWVTGQFDENGLTYDLNGNIKNLQRKGEGGVTIDNLTYNYGTGAMASNKLLYVTDAAAAADKAKGFLDGNTGSDDYTYDANGNMLTDKNKGITTSIAYNFLNLPELVTRGGNTVQYIYDASGRKLAQQVTYAGTTKHTDYAGEFIYEDNLLQFINHEEGRIVVSGEKLLLKDGCENTGNKTAANATLATQTTDGEDYIKVTANGTTVKTGVFPIGGSFPVTPGERYRIRAKGYRTGANAVYLLIRANTTDLGWPGAALPNSAGTEAWIEQVVTIPASTSTLQAGVTWNTVTNGEIFYLNEFEIEQLTTVTPEYQYHLKDHLGNVRITFTSKDETDTFTATLEDNTQAEEQATFKNYSRVTADVYDHTDAGTTYDKAQLLNGGNNSQVGLTKTLAVMPGDVVSAEVYAKYFESTGGSGNLSGFAAALLSAFGLPTPAGGEAGTASAALQSYGAFIAGGGNSGTSGWPKGWLNMLIFDKDYNLVDLAYEQLDGAYMQPVGNPNKLPMQLLSLSKTIKEPGYAYIYISNEGSVQQDIYFDDLTITNEKSKVVQGEDYYPFGLTFNSYSRENSVDQNFLYNGKELQDELNLEWYDYGARMYDPAIARWMAVDPLAEKMRRWSPYNYCFNNPLRFIDPDGMGPNDHYYGMVEGNLTYLGSDGEGDNIRYVKEDEVENVTPKLKDDQTSDEDRTSAREGSQVVNVESEKIQGDLQDVADNSRGSKIEHTMKLVFDIDAETPTITSYLAETGDNSTSPLTYGTMDGETYDGNGKVLLAQAHGHPETTKPGHVTERTMSETDKNTSNSAGIPIYGVDAMNGKKESAQSIHRVTPDGTITNNVGKTKGSGASGFNIVNDALRIRTRK